MPRDRGQMHEQYHGLFLTFTVPFEALATTDGNKAGLGKIFSAEWRSGQCRNPGKDVPFTQNVPERLPRP